MRYVNISIGSLQSTYLTAGVPIGPSAVGQSDLWGSIISAISGVLSRNRKLKMAFVDPSSRLGTGVQIASNAHVGPNCYVQGRVTIGMRSRLVANVTLVGDAHIGSECLIEPNVSMSNVLASADRVGSPLIIGAGCHIGAGSILSCGISIGQHAKIAAGTVVARNVPPYAIVAGNPATITGYSTTLASASAAMPGSDNSELEVDASEVAGVKIFRFPKIRDLRGDLSVGEFERNVPFIPKRYFLVFDVPSAETRGEHAHRSCEQFLICVSGRISVLVDDGVHREEIDLVAPNLGLYVPPKVWAVQYKYSANAVLLVFCSQYYDSDDYIRDYQQFVCEVLI